MIKLIVLDVDGCMTDGKLVFDNNGVESKVFDVKDGLGITTWLKLGNEIAIITGRNSKIVQNRAKELGIKHLFQGVKNKGEVLLSLMKDLGLKKHEVAVIGDDLNDVAMINLAGKSYCPNDATKPIKDLVECVLSSNGGNGAVREMIDLLVLHNNQQEEFLKVWGI